MGLFIGLCVGVFILSFTALIFFTIDEEAKVGVFIYVLTPIILIMCGFSGAVIHKHYTNEQVEGYKMVKIFTQQFFYILYSSAFVNGE